MFKTFKRPIAVMILGRPGSAKDTQAELLAQHYNFIRIETSKMLREEFKINKTNQRVIKEKIIFASGRLNTPSWVASVIKKKISSLKLPARSIVFSGSPRTLYEAKIVSPVLEKKFGKENVFAIYLDITEKEGIQRILKRNERPLDRDVKVLKIRMEEFKKRTAPILDFFKKKGILRLVNGMPSQEIVFKRIIVKLGL